MYLPRCIVSLSLSLLFTASGRECGTCSGPGISAGVLPQALPFRRISTISAHIAGRRCCLITSFPRRSPRCCSVTHLSSAVSLLPPLCRRLSWEASAERQREPATFEARAGRAREPGAARRAACLRVRDHQRDASVTGSTWFAFTLRRVWTTPLGQCSSTMSACGAGPRPKRATCSLSEQ